MLSTSNSGVVSYDVTFQLDQLAAGPEARDERDRRSRRQAGRRRQRPDQRDLRRHGDRGSAPANRSRQRVVTGLAGNSSTIILSGLKAGETVVLPAASSTSSSAATSPLSRLGSRLGGAGVWAAGAWVPAAVCGGGGAFFRGGG